MSKIKNGGLDQYCTESFEQQQFGTAGDEGVKNCQMCQMDRNGSSLSYSSRGLETTISGLHTWH